VFSYSAPGRTFETDTGESNQAIEIARSLEGFVRAYTRCEIKDFGQSNLEIGQIVASVDCMLARVDSKVDSLQFLALLGPLLPCVLVGVVVVGIVVVSVRKRRSNQSGSKEEALGDMFAGPNEVVPL